MAIKKYISKFTKRHVIILFVTIALILSCLYAFNKLQGKIVVTSELTSDNICSNILDKKYTVLRAQVVEKGFFPKHNELFFDIATDEDWKFYDVQNLSIAIDETFTSKYSINNLHFNVYKSSDDFIANYDDADNKSIFQLTSDFKEKDIAKLSQHIYNHNIDITQIDDQNSLYADLFSYSIINASKKNSNIDIQLVTNELPIDSNLYDIILPDMQLIEKDIRKLNSNCKDISLKVYNALPEDKKEVILSSTYWEFNSKDKNSLYLSKDIKIHSENTDKAS